jgi:hypothetical protein
LRSRETGWIAIGYLVIFILINGLNAILHELDLDISEFQNLCKSSVRNLNDLEYSPFSAYFHKVDAPSSVLPQAPDAHHNGSFLPQYNKLPPIAKLLKIPT